MTQFIRERLVLDHFYIPVSPSEIQSLVPLTRAFKTCSHQKVVTDNDQWEGVYLGSRTRAYFEVVHHAKNRSGFGMAFSAGAILTTDARKLVDEFPELPWQKGGRTRKDGSPWFDWLSLGEYESGTPIVNAWVMHYHPGHSSTGYPPTPKSVDRFRAIHLVMGEERRQELKALIPWIPGRQQWEQERIHLEITESEGSIFNVHIRLIPGDQWITFEKLEMDLVRGEEIAPGRFGRFELKVPAPGAAVFELE